MLPVHRITLQALQPNAETACEQIARFLPDAVLGPNGDDSGVIELLVAAEDIQSALERTWDAIAVGGEREVSAVIGAPRR